jgi:hypothetical protein
VADERLRRLERQAAAGDPEAAARLLLERLRLAEVTVEGARLAAYLAEPAAARAFPGVQPGDVSDLRAWLLGLRPWGKETLVRAALAAAHAVLPRFEERLTHERRPRQALEAAEAWLEEATEARRVMANLAADLADDAAREASIDPEADDDSAFAAYACRDAARTAAALALEPARSGEELLATVDQAGAVLFEDDSVQQAIRAALLAWALAAP